MKKIFSVIVALTIIASMSVSAFAAVTMSPFVFRGVGEDGNTYIYHFGTRDNTEEEVGIEINGEKYAALNFDAVTNTKFGIGIADPSNKLGDTYEVLPYAGESYGKAVTVDKNSLSKLLKLNDDELGKVIKEIAKEAGVGDENFTVSKSDLAKIRTFLTFASDEQIASLLKQFGGQKR